MEENKSIRQVGANDIYFYTNDISVQTALDFNTTIMKMASDILCNSNIPKTIVIHINSNGGELFSSIAMMETLRMVEQNGISLTGVIEGCCFSGATLLMLACSTRYVTKNSVALLHYGSVTYDATYNSINDVDELNKNTTMCNKLIYNMYKEGLRNITDEKLKNILSHNLLHITAKEYVKIGLADKII